MINRFFLSCLVFLRLLYSACSPVKASVACGPVPNENQIRWQEMEYYAMAWKTATCGVRAM